MKFAKWVFRISGIYGILVLVPLYFVENNPKAIPPPALTHPEYYYGFIGVALAFQVLFLMVSTDPVKYRLIMIPSVLEKFSFTGAIFALFLVNRVPLSMALSGTLDFSWGVLFLISYLCLAPKK